MYTHTIHPGDGTLTVPCFSDHRNLVQRTPWWAISIVVHAAIMFMAALWVVSDLPEQGPEIWITEMVPIHRRPEYNQDSKRPPTESAIKMPEEEIVTDDTVATREDLEIDELSTADDMDDLQAKGREDAVSTIELRDSGWVTEFGVGGGAAGQKGWPGRGGRAKTRSIGTNGGGDVTEDAVNAALEWFKRHQAPDGSWSMAAYPEQCRGPLPCEHADLERDYHSWDNCATGFALLCFLGAGNTQKGGAYRVQVANGLAYLRAAQQADGSFSDNNYVHAITTMAVVEAYGMTLSAELRDMARRGVDVIIARQNPYLGWTYGNPDTRNDTSVTGWQIMALKSACISGLDVGNAFDGGRLFFDRITPAVTNDSQPRLTDLCAYTYYTDKDDPGHRNGTCTAISLLCRIFMGERAESRTLQGLAARVIEYAPATYQDGDFYLWYYATMAMFQMQGPYWKEWNRAIKDVLCSNQRKDGCADGSWDPTSNFSCQRGGRLFTTAVGCLTMEVYYREPLMCMLQP